MKVKEFNSVYQYAKNVNIVNDDWFNTMGWFWLDLTDKQHVKMYNLLLEQGAEEQDNGQNKYIQLHHGLQLKKLNKTLTGQQKSKQ